MPDDQVVARLDTLIAILQLAFKDRIDEARKEVLADPVAAALLDTAADWTDAGTLQDRVSRATNQSKRTVQRRIAELLSQRFLDQSGSGPTVRYRNTRLV